MTARNDITGDAIASKPASDSYRENFDAIFKTTEAASLRDALGLPDDLQDGETMTQWALRKQCDVCGKRSGDGDVHTCTPPAVLKAQQWLTDLLQIEPGYTGGCTHDCNQGRNCRCGRS